MRALCDWLKAGTHLNLYIETEPSALRQLDWGLNRIPKLKPVCPFTAGLDQRSVLVPCLLMRYQSDPNESKI
jgi:hypothetical protein